MDHTLGKSNKCTLLVAFYLLLTFTTFVSWRMYNRFPVTGDEPHYLVMAQGIIRHHTFEQTPAYRDEFRTPRIFAPASVPFDAVPGPANTHAIRGPHGLYNMHNIGLPMLIAPAYGIGTIIGVKIFLILLSSIVVVISWKASGLFTDRGYIRFLTVAGVTFGLPLLPAANQVYPDLVAGLIALSAGYWLLTAQTPRPLWMTLLWAIAIAYMPWLMIKYAATTVVLAAGIAWLAWKFENKWSTIAAITLPTIVSLFLLAIYNQYAFGKFTGPYSSGDLQISLHSLMVLLGLHLDQDQGLFLQNPIFFVGLVFMGAFWKANWRAAVVLSVAYFSLIVPNSLHPNWYGGWSFCGRFFWAGGILFMLPTIFGLVRVAAYSKKLFLWIVIINLSLQAYFYYLYSFTDFAFYNKLSAGWLDSYSIFYPGISLWLPAFYDPGWAFSYLPNILFLLLALGLLLIGIVAAVKGVFPRISLAAFLALAGVAILVGGFVPFALGARVTLHDPGFEDNDLTAWPSFQNVKTSVGTGQVHGGVHSLTQSEGEGSVYQDISGLKPGEVYVVSAWVSAIPGATAEAQIAIWSTSAQAAAFSQELHATPQWQRLTDSMAAGKDGTLRLHLFRKNGSGALYWDDVTVMGIH